MVHSIHNMTLSGGVSVATAAAVDNSDCSHPTAHENFQALGICKVVFSEESPIDEQILI